MWDSGTESEGSPLKSGIGHGTFCPTLRCRRCILIRQVRMFGSETGELLSLIDKELLPEEFGGTHPYNGVWTGWGDRRGRGCSEGTAVLPPLLPSPAVLVLSYRA